MTFLIKILSSGRVISSFSESECDNGIQRGSLCSSRLCRYEHRQTFLALVLFPVLLCSVRFSYICFFLNNWWSLYFILSVDILIFLLPEEGGGEIEIEDEKFSSILEDSWKRRRKNEGPLSINLKKPKDFCRTEEMKVLSYASWRVSLTFPKQEGWQNFIAYL